MPDTLTSTAIPAPAAPARAAMTSGPVGMLLVSLTLPMVGAVLSTIGYSVAETWFIARLGPAALSAVSFTFPVTMAVISLAIGLGAGTSAVVARALGAGEAAASALVVDALLLTAALGLVAAGIGELVVGPLFRALGAPEALLPLIAGYLRIWFPAATLFMTAMVGLSAARAAGDATFQGVAMAAAALLNLALAVPAIFGAGGWPGLGLRGAALANALSWGPLLLATLWRLRGLGLLADGLPTPGRFLASARRVLHVGLPAAGTNTIIPVSAAVVTAILATYGEKAVAGFGVAGRIESLSMVAFFALSAVMNPFAGQNAGAGRLDRVRAAMRASFGFCLGLGAVTAVVLWFAGPWIAARFSGDPEVAAATAAYLSIVPVSYGMAGIIAVANSAFNGLNRPGAAVLISVARTMLVNVPVAWAGGRLFGAPGVFLGVCAANVLVGLGAAWWIWRATAPVVQPEAALAR
ncbi:MAG TPA: MATE family efflux transporter [Acetobacteraceae bacterium]